MRNFNTMTALGRPVGYQGSTNGQMLLLPWTIGACGKGVSSLTVPSMEAHLAGVQKMTTGMKFFQYPGRNHRDRYDGPLLVYPIGVAPRKGEEAQDTFQI